MSAQPQHYYTPDEYLALERAAEYKSEYLDGAIFAMSGSGVAHNDIVSNVIWQLRTALQGRACRVWSSAMRVQVATTGLYTYPDVTIVCGPREFADDQADTLLNPTILFEILSPATEGYDRGKKFAHYGRLPALTDYVLVAQEEVRVEHFQGQGNSWLLTAFTTLDETLHLAAIESRLPLRGIYENVEFPLPAPRP